MVYTTPDKWADGETVIESKLNTQIDNIPALYDRLVHEVGVNYSASTWTPSNSAGNWETDTSGCTVSLTMEKTSTVIVAIVAKWYVTAAVDQAMMFRVENTTDGTYSDSCGLYGSSNDNNREMALVIGVFTGQTAGAKVYRLNGSRVSSAYTVNVTARFIAAVAVSTV